MGTPRSLDSSHSSCDEMGALRFLDSGHSGGFWCSGRPVVAAFQWIVVRWGPRGDWIL